MGLSSALVKAKKQFEKITVYKSDPINFGLGAKQLEILRSQLLLVSSKSFLLAVTSIIQCR